MATLKTLLCSPVLSNFKRRMFHATGSVLICQNWNFSGCQQMRRMMHCCYGDSKADPSLVSELTSQNHLSLLKFTRCHHLPNQLIRSFPAYPFSTSASICADEDKEGCIPPRNDTTTPVLDGPTLSECGSPQAAVRWWSAAFSSRGVPGAQVSAEFLVAHALGLKQLHELTNQVLSSPLTQSQLALINKLCCRRQERIPVQYILGDWDFRDITLIVRPPVFIPRPETEMLVDIAIGHYPEDKKLHFLEVGCGSGAISISVLMELPLAQLTCIDRSEEAVQLTMENARRLGVQDRLTVHHARMTSDLPPCLHGQRGSFDAIISNPPYVSNQDMDELRPEIKLYEDLGALCGGPDGMDIIKDILHLARDLLKPGGSIWLETDCKHPEDIQKWLGNNQQTGVQFIRMYKDYNDKPRFCHLKFQH